MDHQQRRCGVSTPADLWLVLWMCAALPSGTVVTAQSKSHKLLLEVYWIMIKYRDKEPGTQTFSHRAEVMQSHKVGSQPVVSGKNFPSS